MPEFDETIFPKLGVPEGWVPNESVAKELEAVQRKYKRFMDLVQNPPVVEVGATPAEVVYSENKLKLKHYIPASGATHPTPVLIVYALINRPYILDLQPDRSVVRKLLEAGLDVYLIDWGVPSDRDRYLTLNDYINGYIDRCVDCIREHTGREAVTVFGYCMGGTMSTMYAAIHPEKVANLVIMAAGIDFSTNAGTLNMWSRASGFDVDKLVDTMGNIQPEFLNGGYDLLDPVNNFWAKYIRFMDKLDDEEFVQMFFRMEKWVKDGIPLAGDAFRDFLKYGYQQNLLVKNEFPVNYRKVDLRNITMPLLNIIGTYDHLVPPESSRPLPELVSSSDKMTLELATGHIGLSVSSKSHRDLWPKAIDWLKERSGPVPGSKKAAPAARKAAKRSKGRRK